MKLESKKILILGMGITGKASAQALSLMGAELRVMDDHMEDLLLRDPQVEQWREKALYTLEEVRIFGPDLCVKSPGIPPTNETVMGIRGLGVEVISDLEMAYRLFPERKILAISGTNGKTTTTALVGAIMRQTGQQVHVAGNIGVGMLEEFRRGGPEDIYVIECSSFQLEDTRDFCPTAAALINITPDHIDWHGSMEAYVKAKGNLLRNMQPNESYVMNIDDPRLREISNTMEAKAIPISLTQSPKDGYGLHEGGIYEVKDGESVKIIDVSEIQIPGSHNIENVMIAIALTRAVGTSIEDVQKAIREFKGVAHRLEFIREFDGVRYYNDSKGTNVDATIKAIEALPGPLILFAGGYDKKVSFRDLFEAFDGKVKELLLMGETQQLLREYAEEYQIPYTLVSGLEEGVHRAKQIARTGDQVLLSPASASWGMYPNFEVRGEHFRQLVESLE